MSGKGPSSYVATSDALLVIMCDKCCFVSWKGGDSIGPDQMWWSVVTREGQYEIWCRTCRADLENPKN